jgi:hypothetical protein
MFPPIANGSARDYVTQTTLLPVKARPKQRELAMTCLRTTLFVLLMLSSLAFDGRSIPAQSGGPKAPSPDPPVVVLARWHGTYSFRWVAEASFYRGLALILSSSGCTTEGQASMVFREERNRFGTVSTVVESVTWTCKVTDLHYTDETKRKIPAGDGGSGGGSFSEKDLLSAQADPDPKVVADLQKALAKAKADEAAAKAKLVKDENKIVAANAEWNAAIAVLKSKGAAAEFAELDQENALDNYERDINDDSLSAAQKMAAFNQWRQALRAKQSAQNALTSATSAEALKHRLFLDAHVACENDKTALNQAEQALRDAQDAVDGLYKAWQSGSSASVQMTTDAKTGQRQVTVGFSIRKKMTFPVKFLPLKREEAFGVVVDNEPKTRYDSMKVLFGNVKGQMNGEQAELTDSFKRGDNEWKVSWRRVPVSKETLVVKGEIYHRVCIPKNEKNFNVVLVGDTWKEGIIPVRGRVRVEAWTPRVNPKDARAPLIPPGQPADIVSASDDNGKFELSIPNPVEVKTIRLRFTYASKEAQLTECTSFDMGSEYIRKGLGATDKATQLDPVDRLTQCWLRWENKPKDFIAGGARRIGGPVVRRNGATTTLEFNKMNGIFVNSFVFKTPHVNQVQNELNLTGVKVPAKKILEVLALNTSAADFKNKDAEVRKRLGVPADKAVVPEEVATDVTISGGEVCFPSSTAVALRFLGKINNPEDGIQQIGQGCYDYYYNAKKKMNPKAFPYKPVQFNATLWPFAEPVGGENNNKKWLVTCTETAYDTKRPWQVAGDVEPFLRGYVKSQFAIDSNLSAMNVFQSSSDREVLLNLGRGNPAAVSINHLKEEATLFA